MNPVPSPNRGGPSSGSPTSPEAKTKRFRIENRLIYWGIVVLMASLLLWLGAELAKRVEWFLPYAAGFGLALIALGYYLEIRKSRRVPAAGHPPQDPA